MNQSAILETELAPYFTTRAPFQFPINFKEGFVKYWPIVTLILLILAIPAILVFLGIGAALVPFSYAGGVGAGFGYTLSMVFSIIQLVLAVLALPGLFNKKRQGWVFSYYSQLISIVGAVISIHIVGTLIGLLFLMLLFQVREYYN